MAMLPSLLSALGFLIIICTSLWFAYGNLDDDDWYDYGDDDDTDETHSYIKNKCFYGYIGLIGIGLFLLIVAKP